MHIAYINLQSSDQEVISGLLIVKTDAGPGCLSKDADSVVFCKQMAALGIHTILLLPNATSCMTEMDQLFEKFKPACSMSELWLAAKKMQLRMEVRVAETDKDNESDGNKDMDPIKPVLDKLWGCGNCSVSITNLDLKNLVNGCPDDPIELWHSTAPPTQDMACGWVYANDGEHSKLSKGKIQDGGRGCTTRYGDKNDSTVQSI